MPGKLKAIPLEGLNTDCLGNYLAALGLLVAVSQQWSTMRGCWRNGRFVLLSDDLSFDLTAIRSFLLKDWRATAYQRWWSDIQKADTKAKSSDRVWRERSQRSMEEVRVLDAHIVGTGRNRFNPVLGTGGNVGKRDLAKACKDAAKLLSKPESARWLCATLSGEPDAILPDLSNGGTWFVYANKTFNSGQSWYREGQLSPWSQLLATEGALLLVGGVNRRLGSRARPYAVFPFVAEPSQPATGGEIGMSRAEFWAPLWDFPATLREVRFLFQRGLAKLGGRPAQAPHEFAVAALDAGVDSGVSEFARFELRQTTSSQVYEAIPRPHIRVGASEHAAVAESASESISPLLVDLIESGWLDRLPFEPRDSKQRGKFVGLRGPIEAAIVQLAECPNSPERWQHLLLLLATAQSRIDRNKTLRERSAPLPLLPVEWFTQVWPIPPREIELARAIASIGWHLSADSKKPIPLQANVFGVALTSRRKSLRIELPATRPPQAVWGPGDPLQVLLNVAQRRLVDAEGLPRSAFVGTRSVPAALIEHFLSDQGDTDLEQVAKWIPPLSLINWSFHESRRYATSRPSNADGQEPSIPGDGTTMLHALVRPLFHVDEANRKHFRLERTAAPLFRRDQLPKPNLLRRLFYLFRFGQIDEAVQALRDRYLAVGQSIVMPPDGIVANGERIAGALLIPMRSGDVARGLKRWLQPARAR